MSSATIGRNAPCPCGSGKRFKHCHGAADRPPVEPLATEPPRRDAREASRAWWRALETDPENAEASFHLGNFNLERGEHRAALIHYQRTLRGVPDHAMALNNLGLCYKALGFLDRAEESFRAALAAQPARHEALRNLANLLYQRERYADVVSATERLPDGAPGRIRLVRALCQDALGDAGGAEATLREAVRLDPDDAALRGFLAALDQRSRST